MNQPAHYREERNRAVGRWDKGSLVRGSRQFQAIQSRYPNARTSVSDTRGSYTILNRAFSVLEPHRVPGSG
jgi:hypothetical protein